MFLTQRGGRLVPQRTSKETNWIDFLRKSFFVTQKRRFFYKRVFFSWNLKCFRLRLLSQQTWATCFVLSKTVTSSGFHPFLAEAPSFGKNNERHDFLFFSTFFLKENVFIYQKTSLKKTVCNPTLPSCNARTTALSPFRWQSLLHPNGSLNSPGTGN